MAKVDIQMPDDFLEKLSRLGNRTDAIAETVLKNGGEVVLEKVKSNLASVIGSSTGELEEALGLSGVLVDRDGDSNIKIGFREPRRDGNSNAKIANILEYGRHGQPAKPFLKPAKTASESACIDAMVRTLEEEIKKV